MDIIFIGEDIIKSKGGVVTVMKNILDNQFLNKRISFYTIYTSIEGSCLFKKIWLWVSGYFKLLFKIRKIKIVHMHHSIDFNFWMTAFFLINLKALKRKVILHNHGADFKQFYYKQSILKQKIIKKIFEKADLNIILSKSWFNWYSSISPNANWKILYNSIYIPQEKQQPKTDNRLKLVFLGRLEKRKGIFDLLDIMPDLIKENPGIILRLIGQGNNSDIESKINSYGITESVELYGYLNKTDINVILSDSDIFLLPSYDEGLPMALLEAMAYGLATITCPVGGIPEVIDDKVDGLLVDAGDKNMLLQAINSLIKDKDLQHKISTNAKLKIKEHFNIENYSHKLFEIYNSML